MLVFTSLASVDFQTPTQLLLMFRAFAYILGMRDTLEPSS